MRPSTPSRALRSAACLALPTTLLATLSACGGHEASAADDPADTHLRFVDVASEAGIDFTPTCGDPRRWTIGESNGTGAAWLDHDGDGDLDLFVGNGPRVTYVDDMATLALAYPEGTRLFANEDSEPGAFAFRDVTAEAAAGVEAWVNGVTVGDPDGDGDPDLYLTALGADVFLRNEGGSFSQPGPVETGLANELWGTGASFGDPDRDGDLDLFVANYCLFDPAAPPQGGERMVYQGVELAWGPEAENPHGYNAGAPDVYFENDGSGRFAEATAAHGLALERAWCSYAALFRDVDADGWPDLLVANDAQPSNLFHNQGDGTFAEEATMRGFATDSNGEATAAMGLFVADVDRDGDLDSLRTNFDGEPNGLYVNDGEGRFREQAARAGLAMASADRLGWGGGFFDADLDGDLDLVVANGHVLPQAEEIGMSPYLQRSQLFEGVDGPDGFPEWRAVPVDAGSGFAPARNTRGVALGDPDDDGDLDLVLVDIDAPVRVLENRSERRGDWVGVTLVGRDGNRDALGARVSVRLPDDPGAGTWTQEQQRVDGLFSSHDPRLHFGLGNATGATVEFTVRWPDGEESVHGDLAVGRYHRVEQPPR